MSDVDMSKVTPVVETDLPSRDTCKICGAPRARREDGSYHRLQMCETHRLARQHEYTARCQAKKIAASQISVTSPRPLEASGGTSHDSSLSSVAPISTDIAIADPVGASMIASIVFEWYHGVPDAPKPRRRRTWFRPRRLHNHLRRLIAVPDFAHNQIVYVRGRIVRSAAMPPTYGDLKKQLLDDHQHGYYIAQ